MSKAATGLVVLIALIHVSIMGAEMLAWDRMGARLLNTDDTGLLTVTAPMAFNQGLYNGFLAAGLIWSLLIADVLWKKRIAMFFVICVGVAGVVGAATVSPTILYVQTVPAVIALVLLFLTGPKATKA